MKYAALLMTLTLMGCAKDERIVVTAVNTICTSTTRYHATEAQTAALKADKALWQPLVDWLASFNKVRDSECLAPPATSR